jgi:hypothetical protein
MEEGAGCSICSNMVKGITNEALDKAIKNCNWHITELENILSDYSTLANLVLSYIDLKPEHPFYNSLRKDINYQLNKLRGKPNG